MNGREPAPAEMARRRSRNVALVFLGTVGVVGGLVAWEAWQRAQAATTWPPPSPQPAAQPLSADRTYANNEFIPGVGYYHAPYHAWYPYPFNYHDPARGYFGGGLWQVAPFLLGVLSSRPNNDAVVAALAVQRARDDEQRRQQAQARASGAGGFHSSGFVGGSGYSAARPGGSAPTGGGSGSSISRGGFGGSAHGGGAGA